MKIEQWLEEFRQAWQTKDIDAVMSMFTDDVEYWETPHQLVGDLQALRQEWQAIKQQEDIVLDLDVFGSSDNRHSVRWNLSYMQDRQPQKWAGVYLIELNTEGKCLFFHQTGEKSVK